MSAWKLDWVLVPALALVLALLAVGAHPAPGRTSDSSCPSRSPERFLVVRKQAVDKTPEDGLAIDLALRSLSPSRQREVLASFQALADDLEARANPLVPSLDEEPPGAALRALSPSLLPTLTAARYLAPGAWQVERVSLSLAKACPQHAEACIPLSHARTSLHGARKAAVWPLAYAILLDAPEPLQRKRIVQALRRRVGEDGSSIALVVDTWRPGVSAQRKALGLLATKAAAIACKAKHETCGILSAMAQPPATRRLAFALDDSEILVVPKLGSLARHGVFERQVLGAAKGARCRWGCSMNPFLP